MFLNSINIIRRNIDEIFKSNTLTRKNKNIPRNLVALKKRLKSCNNRERPYFIKFKPLNVKRLDLIITSKIISCHRIKAFLTDNKTKV